MARPHALAASSELCLWPPQFQVDMPIAPAERTGFPVRPSRSARYPSRCRHRCARSACPPHSPSSERHSR
eukprot:7598909-Heterocapsa_arctica.AAC.1